MLKTSIGIIISIFLFSGVLSPNSLRGQTAEKADRTGLESVWKKSGRTTRVIDYPYSPQPGIYGGETIREWGNRGYIFINPRADEFVRRRTGRDIAREEIAAEPEDCRELREELLNEVAANEQLRRERDRLVREAAAIQEIADDRALKIEALEFQVEELERTTRPVADGSGDWAVDPGRAPSEATGAGVRIATYMVREGDSLWKIAGREEIYNDPYRWLLLYHANRDQIFLPDLIYPGMVLLVPRYRELEENIVTSGPDEPAEENIVPAGQDEPAGEETWEPEATPVYEAE